MSTTDERGGLPSASNSERYWNCPGSHRLSRGIPDNRTDEQKAWAEAGERIHLWLDDPDFIKLEGDELEVAQKCAAQRDEQMRLVFGENWRNVTKIKEKRLWLTMARRKVFSGKSDDISLYELVGLLLDYKTNRGETPPSPTNRQLRYNAVLLWLESGRELDRIFVGIIQPLTSKPLLCEYGREDLEKSMDELEMMLDEMEKPDAALKAGDWCKWCPAKLVCPKAADVLKQLGEIPKKSVASKEGADIATLLDLCETAKPIIKAIEERAKAMIKAEAGSVPGWTIGKGSSTRTITNVVGTFKVLESMGVIDSAGFMERLAGISIGDVEDEIKRAKNCTGDEAKKLANAHLEPFIAIGTKAGSLERVA